MIFCGDKVLFYMMENSIPGSGRIDSWAGGAAYDAMFSLNGAICRSAAGCHPFARLRKGY
jgi:hypothetical protein